MDANKTGTPHHNNYDLDENLDDICECCDIIDVGCVGSCHLILTITMRRAMYLHRILSGILLPTWS